MKLADLAKETADNSLITICERLLKMIMEEARCGGYRIIFHEDEYPHKHDIIKYFRKEGFSIDFEGMDDEYIEISW